MRRYIGVICWRVGFTLRRSGISGSRTFTMHGCPLLVSSRRDSVAPDTRSLDKRRRTPDPAVQHLTNWVAAEHDPKPTFARYQSSHSVLDIGAAAGVINAAASHLGTGANAGCVATVMERRLCKADDRR